MTEKMLFKVIKDFNIAAKEHQPLCMSFLSHLSYHSCGYIESYLRRHGALSVFTTETPAGSRCFVAEFETFSCVSFRGTGRINSTPIVKRQFQFWKKEFLGVRVHHGFATIIEEIIPKIDEPLKAISKDKPLYYVGHSLGGALATLLQLHKKADCIYTFGSPKVGCGHKFKQHFNSIPYYRYQSMGDLVPVLPFWWIGYTHIAPGIILKNSLNPITAHGSLSYVRSFL